MNPGVRKYTLAGLAGTPSVVSAMLAGVPDDADLWDLRPDPIRFTLREVLAHLADWDDIWICRVNRILTEDTPTLVDVDEGKAAVDNGYSGQVPSANRARFAANRAKLMSLLASLDDDQWSREGDRPPVIGLIRLDELIAMVLGHDGYHTDQIAHWVSQK